MELRPYQREAVASIFSYYGAHSGNALLSIATGCGKSYILAEFLRQALTAYPTTRAIVATFAKELVQQNHDELMRLWPGAPAGILSAGLQQRNTSQQIIFAGIQTAYKMAFKLQRCDILLIDESQAVPHSQDGIWRQFINDLLRINPKMKIIGLSATIFRLDSGLLHRGKNRLFHDVIYEYGLLEAIQQGYLCEVIPAPTVTALTTKGVHKRGGEYIPGELERAVDKADITTQAVAEIVRLGADRKSWLIFAAGVKHAEHIAEAVRAHGVGAKAVTGALGRKERDTTLADFKAFKLRCIVVVGIGNVGFNHPGLDLIASLRPTNSAGLWLQQAGRGTRLYPGKTNCLLLDFAQNSQRHGALDQIRGHDPKERNGTGEVPQKICLLCHCYAHASAKLCPDCSAPFPTHSIDEKLTGTASNAALLSSQIKPAELEVKSWEFYTHEKIGAPVSLRVAYRTGITVQNEWVHLQRQGYMRNKAVQWWSSHGGQLPPPATVSEAVARKAELRMPRAITVQQAGKYTEIVGKHW